MCGSTTNSQLNRRLDRWCSPQVHLKSNERKVEWDYAHKAVHHRGKLRMWENVSATRMKGSKREYERRERINGGKSKLDIFFSLKGRLIPLSVQCFFLKGYSWQLLTYLSLAYTLEAWGNCSLGSVQRKQNPHPSTSKAHNFTCYI